LKALSLKQPWANLIACGKKTIETRRWATDFRGEILIVSSKLPKIEPAGCAVAVARLVECRPMTLSDERAAMCDVYENAIAWILRDVQPIRPFPVTGQLGLFEVVVDASSLTPIADVSHYLSLFEVSREKDDFKR
jgi:ASCH domain-containing protein